MLALEGLSRRFGSVTALENLTFAVPAGQVMGFLGPNGAGKTTTMRAIFGLMDLDAGSVRWNGAPVGAAQRRRFGVHAGGTRAVPEHAAGRTGRVPRAPARDERATGRRGNAYLAGTI